MNAKQRVAASRAEQPDDLAANESGCDRMSLRAALMKRNITPNQPGIRQGENAMGMIQVGLRFFGLMLVAATMISGGAYGQSPSTEVMPPLSYPMWLYLQKNPQALRDLMSKQIPPSAEPGPAPQTGPSPVPSQTAPTGPPDPVSPWQLLNHPLGLNVSNPLLLTDGTVIVHRTCTRDWWRLTPDINGSYVNGGWSQIASLPSGYVPTFFASAVLPDGRVIVEGGEYNDNCRINAVWTNLGAIYDPLADSWKPVSPPPGFANIGDAQSVVLSDGTFMLANALTKQQALLNASANPLTWMTPNPPGKFDVNDEEGWTLLWDGNVLAVDAYAGTGSCDSNSELYLTRYIRFHADQWITAGSTVQRLPDCGSPNFSFELGPQVLRPDGTVIAFGGTTTGVAHTAIFDSTTRTWTAGPDLPTIASQNYTLADAPAALLPSGNVLFAASPGLFQLPTHFFEFEYRTNKITQVADTSDAATITSYRWNFLVLPTGQILACETDFNNIWIYTPSGSPDPEWAPDIAAVPYNLSTGLTYQVIGRQLNGLSQGAAYGDDVQAATNYPLVRIVNATTGHVFYARTFDHSTMGIGPDSFADRQFLEDTNFTVPAGIEPGASYLYVVANGIASEPFAVNIVP
jgi:hypothetical protein